MAEPKKATDKSVLLGSTTRVSVDERLAQIVAEATDETRDKKASTAAAQRIFERLQRKSTEPGKAPSETPSSFGSQSQEPDATVVDAVDSISPGPPRKAQPEEQENIHDIMLIGELAQVYEAMQAGWLARDAVVEIMLQRLQKEKTGETLHFLDVALEQRYLKQDQVARLKEVVQSNRKASDLPKISKMDLVLGQILVEYKLLERKQLQIFLRVVHNLMMLGIDRNLPQLLIASKTLAADIVNPLLDQCRQQAQQKIADELESMAVSTKALMSKTSRTYPVVTITAVVIVVFVVFLGSNLFQKAKRISTLPTSTTTEPVTVPVPEPTPTPEPITPIQPPQPPPISTPVPEVVSPKILEKQLMEQMQDRGLIQWGPYWIPIEHRKELAQKWEVGTKAGLVQFLVTEWNVRYQPNTLHSKPMLIVQGRWDVPQLPAGMNLVLDAQLLHGLKDSPPYGLQNFLWRPGPVLEVAWDPLPKELAPGIYWIRISLIPEIQTEFLRFFLSLTEKKTWEIPIAIGTPKEVAQYYPAYRQELEKIGQQLRNVHQQLQRMLQKGKKLSSSEWNQTYQNWQSELQGINDLMQNLLKQNWIPTFMDVPLYWDQTYQQLQHIVLLLDTWHKSFETGMPNLAAENARFEKQFAAMKLHLIRQERSLVKMLSQPILIYALK